jgi:hypothetical protein
MTARHVPEILLARDEIVAPPLPRACDDRTFELPPVLHILTALMFLGFVTVLSVAFSGHMIVSYGVFVAFIVAFFAVPALWVRMKPEENRSRALEWYEFMDNGIDTASGRTSGFAASVLVLLLPFLILCWAIAVALIAALV